LAHMYEMGRGVKADSAQAMKLYQQAANLDYPLAQLSLAAMYRDGMGVKKDTMQAFQWYKIAQRRIADRMGASAAAAAGAADRAGPENDMLSEATRNITDIGRSMSDQDKYNATRQAENWKPFDPNAGKPAVNPKDQPLFYDQ